MNLEEEINKLSEYDLEKVSEIIEKRKFEINKQHEIDHAETLLRIAKSRTFEESKRGVEEVEFDYTHR